LHSWKAAVRALEVPSTNVEDGPSGPPYPGLPKWKWCFGRPQVAFPIVKMRGRESGGSGYAALAIAEHAFAAVWLGHHVLAEMDLGLGMLPGYPCFVAAIESDFDLIFAALAKRKVRYLVVGGVAVVLHGVPRFTADVDLVLALDKANVLAALDALAGLGYRPRAPVPLLDFANPDLRRDWIQEKGLTVFSLWSTDHPATEIDLFIEEPFPFEEVFARATQVDLGSNHVTVASVSDLIELKRRADRPKDREDIEQLMALVEGGTRG